VFDRPVNLIDEIGSPLHLVAGAAIAHHGCGVHIRELIAEGYVGLMRAACPYDPNCDNLVDVETLSVTPPRYVHGSR